VSRYKSLGVAGVCLLFLAACASEALHKDGLRAIEAGQFEEGLQKLAAASKASPGNLTYIADLKGRKEEAVQVLIGEADRARSQGKLEEAEKAFQRVLSIESGNARATRGLETVARDRRHLDIIAKAKKDISEGRLDEAEARLRTVLAEDPGSSVANNLRAQVDTARGPRRITPHLKAKDNRPVTLQFRDANTKMVFEVLSRQTGINFIFDKDVKSDGKTTIFVQNVPVEQAIGLVLGQNALGQQVLAENMVLIYPNTQAKQKEYQDQIVRTFYVSNTDPKKAMEMLKTVLNAKTLYVDEHASAIVMRDTPDAVRMAERLLTSVDVPEAEVMMEVEVLEITRSRLEQLGVNFPKSLAFKPTALAGDPLVIRDIGQQDDTTIQVSGVAMSLDLSKDVGTANVLASPRIRARNHEKAKVLIGQRVPVISNTVTASNGGSINTGSVQYVDVGLTLDVEPTVYLDNDVAIKVNLEVSSIVKEVRVGGNSENNPLTLAYQIGTRNATTLLRLKDGETQILAGLINDQDRRSSSHVPGLGDMPVLGRLFGSRHVDAEKTEVVLSITPRIIRAQPRPGSENTEFYYGTESTLRSAPMVQGTTNDSSGNAALKPSRSSSLPAGAAIATESTAPAPAVDNGGETITPAAASTEPASSEEKVEKQSVSRPALRWDGPGQAAVGQDIAVTLHIDNATSLASIKSVVRFDPAALQFTGGEAGELIPDEQKAAAQPRADAGGGRVRLELSGSNVNGDGALMTLHFRALSPRPTTLITLQQFSAVGVDKEPSAAMAPRPLVISVTP
jgi:general secretion pathway protein D